MTEPPPDYATTTAVAGLARELEALRRTVDTLPTLAVRVDNVAGLVAKLAEQLAAQTVAEPDCLPTWLALEHDGHAIAHQLLDKVVEWMAVVYLRYADAAAGLPDCWLFHPDVIEELLWLSVAWQAAYYGPDASIRAVADWHDRQRPGVVTRIKTIAAACSIENHQHPPAPAPAVPLADAAPVIAQWWGLHRTGPPPTPTPDQLAAATARRTPRGRR